MLGGIHGGIRAEREGLSRAKIAQKCVVPAIRISGDNVAITAEKQDSIAIGADAVVRHARTTQGRGGRSIWMRARQKACLAAGGCVYEDVRSVIVVVRDKLVFGAVEQDELALRINHDCAAFVVLATRLTGGVFSEPARLPADHIAIIDLEGRIRGSAHECDNRPILAYHGRMRACAARDITDEQAAVRVPVP